MSFLYKCSNDWQEKRRKEKHKNLNISKTKGAFVVKWALFMTLLVVSWVKYIKIAETSFNIAEKYIFLLDHLLLMVPLFPIQWQSQIFQQLFLFNC